MNTLIIFICGFLSAIIVLPVINSIVEIFYTWAEVKKARLALQISQVNSEIAKLGANPLSVIGFSDNEDVLEFDDEEDFEFPPSSRLNPIGFSGGLNGKK